MTSLPRSHRRAEEFAARVDAAGATLRAIPEQRSGSDETDPDGLLGMVATLRRTGVQDLASRPDPAFSAGLRERLMAEALDVDAPRAAVLTPRPPARARRERRLVAAVTAAILVGGGAGMATASKGSLPGDVLYPVKRGIERAQVTVSRSPVDRGRDLLDQAGARLVEVRGLLDGGTEQRTRVPGTLDVFSAQAREGTDLLVASYETTDDEATIDEVRSFAAESLADLKVLSKAAPRQILSGFQDAAVVMTDVDTQATSACVSCSDLPPLEIPRVLSTTDADGTAQGGSSAAGGSTAAGGTSGSDGSDGTSGTDAGGSVVLGTDPATGTDGQPGVLPAEPDGTAPPGTGTTSGPTDPAAPSAPADGGQATPDEGQVSPESPQGEPSPTGEPDPAPVVGTDGPAPTTPGDGGPVTEPLAPSPAGDSPGALPKAESPQPSPSDAPPAVAPGDGAGAEPGAGSSDAPPADAVGPGGAAVAAVVDSGPVGDVLP